MLHVALIAVADAVVSNDQPFLAYLTFLVARFERAVLEHEPNTSVIGSARQAEMGLAHVGRRKITLGWQCYRQLPKSSRRVVIRWMTSAASSVSGQDYALARAGYYKPRGSAYHQKREYDLAIADFTEAIHLNPADSDALYYRGEA